MIYAQKPRVCAAHEKCSKKCLLKKQELRPCIAELVCNSAALLRFPSIQAAEFKSNSALPKLLPHQITQHEEQEWFVGCRIALGAVNA